MKRIIFYLMATLCLTACNKEDDNETWEIDLTPIEFKFDITNAAGESLIDKDSPAYDSAFIANTYVKFQGKEYKMDEDAKIDAKPSTRAYYETFHGAMAITQTAYGTNESKVLVRVGPFLSNYDWESEEIEIHWGDNSEDKIVFTSVITSRDKHGMPSFNREFRFNGVDNTETFFTPYSYIKLTKKDSGNEN